MFMITWLNVVKFLVSLNVVKFLPSFPYSLVLTLPVTILLEHRYYLRKFSQKW